MKTTLLRRYRFPLFALAWGGAELAGIAYNYQDPKLTTVGIVAFFIAAGLAVVLNSIDESPKTIAEKYEPNQKTEQ